MCVTSAVMAGVSLATAVLGTATTVHSQVQAGKQQKKMADYNSQLSKRDAELAEIKANEALAQGQKDQEKARLEYKARRGQMAAKFGASNVALDSGSALNMLADTTEAGELDALDIGAKAERQSQDYLRAAEDARNKAGIYTENGSLAMNGALLGAGNSLISGVGSTVSGAQDLFDKINSPSAAKSASASYSQSNTASSSKSSGLFGSTGSTSTYSKKRGPSYF